MIIRGITTTIVGIIRGIIMTIISIIAGGALLHWHVAGLALAMHGLLFIYVLHCSSQTRLHECPKVACTQHQGRVRKGSQETQPSPHANQPPKQGADLAEAQRRESTKRDKPDKNSKQHFEMSEVASATHSNNNNNNRRSSGKKQQQQQQQQQQHNGALASPRAYLASSWSCLSLQLSLLPFVHAAPR